MSKLEFRWRALLIAISVIYYAPFIHSLKNLFKTRVYSCMSRLLPVERVLTRKEEGTWAQGLRQGHRGAPSRPALDWM